MDLINRIDGEVVVPGRPYRSVLKELSALGDAARDAPYAATSDIFCGVLNQHRPSPSTRPTVDLDRFPISMAAVKAVSAALAADVRGIIGDQGLPAVAAL